MWLCRGWQQFTVLLPMELTACTYKDYSDTSVLFHPSMPKQMQNRVQSILSLTTITIYFVCVHIYCFINAFHCFHHWAIRSSSFILEIILHSKGPFYHYQSEHVNIIVKLYNFIILKHGACTIEIIQCTATLKQHINTTPLL